MMKFLLLIGATVGGALGWWIGSLFGIWGTVMLSVVGTAAGVYWARRYSLRNF